MRIAMHLAALAALAAIGLALGRWLRDPNAGGLVMLVLLVGVVGVALRRLYRPRPAAPEAAPEPLPVPPEPEPEAPLWDHRVDINSAGEADLIRLPGVGPVAAARILAERAAGGPFASVEDLTRVPGFGPAKVRVLAPDARCGPSARSPTADRGG
jgi:competence ComEA-like helix-hairpin-helix protein